MGAMGGVRATHRPLAYTPASGIEDQPIIAPTSIVARRLKEVKPTLQIACMWICASVITPLVPVSGLGDPSEIVIGLVADGASQFTDEIETVFRNEILALTEGELDVSFSSFSGDWTRASIADALESAYADPTVDMVLVTGLVANQTLGARESFEKPTFLPLVVDSRLLGLPRSERGSGKPNLSYLVDDVDFSVDLGHFLEVAEFRRLGMLIDAIILDAVGRIARAASGIASDMNVEIVMIPYSDPESDLTALIPPGVDAVMVGELGRLSDAAIDRLIQGLIDRKLPSFSLAGDSLVRRGILAA